MVGGSPGEGADIEERASEVH